MDTILPSPSGHESLPSQKPDNFEAPEFVGVRKQKNEIITPGPERLQAANQAVAQAQSAPTLATGVPALQTMPGSATATQATTVPSMADDVPVIEKEWVTLAKDIIARTRLDPGRQSTELEAIKFDYVRKRFGKDVKHADSGA